MGFVHFLCDFAGHKCFRGNRPIIKRESVESAHVRSPRAFNFMQYWQLYFVIRSYVFCRLFIHCWHLCMFYISLPSLPAPRSVRYEKCQTCYSHLVVLREDVEKAGKDSGTGAADAIRDTALLDCFSVLDWLWYSSFRIVYIVIHTLCIYIEGTICVLLRFADILKRIVVKIAHMH